MTADPDVQRKIAVELQADVLRRTKPEESPRRRARRAELMVDQRITREVNPWGRMESVDAILDREDEERMRRATR